MEREKRQKIIKILCYSLLGLALALSITFFIVSAVYRQKKDDLDKKNQEIEDLYQSEPADELFTKLMIDN